MSKVLRGAGVLAVCALIAKLIGALYRIPLTNIVGAEGIGLYQMVFPLYTVLLTVSSGGLPVAISKVVSARIADKDEEGARQVLKVSLLTLSIAGLVCGVFIVLFKDRIATIQGNAMAALPYLGIAPSLVFVAIISCFRGYFQGKQNMFPSAISQLIEQIIKLSAGLFLAKIFIRHSLEAAILGALLGVSLSEFIAMLVLLLQFFVSDAKYKKRVRLSVQSLNTEAAAELIQAGAVREVRQKNSIIKEVYKVAIPVTLGSLVLPMTQVIDSILVINILVGQGLMRSDATSLFGLVTGPINSLINMPVVLTLSLSVALLPKISECFKTGESPQAHASQGMRLSFLLGLFSSLILCTYSSQILSLLYSRGLNSEQLAIGSRLLAFGGISVVYVSILQVATAVLQGADMAHKPALNLLYGAVFKVIFTLLLLPMLGILGAMLATVICYGITCFLDVWAMKKHCPLKLKLKDILFVPTLASILFVAISLSLTKFLPSFMPSMYANLIALVVASAAFTITLIIFKTIKPSELPRFKKSDNKKS